jgi:hypothetical protein
MAYWIRFVCLFVCLFVVAVVVSCCEMTLDGWRLCERERERERRRKREEREKEEERGERERANPKGCTQSRKERRSRSVASPSEITGSDISFPGIRLRVVDGGEPTPFVACCRCPSPSLLPHPPNIFHSSLSSSHSLFAFTLCLVLALFHSPIILKQTKLVC